MDEPEEDWDCSECSSVLEYDDSESEEFLGFASRISEELRSCFQRNIGNEDYCDDIYEDKFSVPASGSFSYYADLLAVAQLRAVPGSTSNKELQPKIWSNQQPNALEAQNIISDSTWMCSGHRNPSVGAGPLEELFRVLDPNTYLPVNSTSMNLATSWSTNPSLFGTVSGQDDYSNFMDVFHRWNNDEFTLPFASANGNNFRILEDC